MYGNMLQYNAFLCNTQQHLCTAVSYVCAARAVAHQGGVRVQLPCCFWSGLILVLGVLRVLLVRQCLRLPAVATGKLANRAAVQACSCTSHPHLASILCFSLLSTIHLLVTHQLGALPSTGPSPPRLFCSQSGRLLPLGPGPLTTPKTTSPTAAVRILGPPATASQHLLADPGTACACQQGKTDTSRPQAHPKQAHNATQYLDARLHCHKSYSMLTLLIHIHALHMQNSYKFCTPTDTPNHLPINAKCIVVLGFSDQHDHLQCCLLVPPESM
jgi:hypothetical protein